MSVGPKFTMCTAISTTACQSSEEDIKKTAMRCNGLQGKAQKMSSLPLWCKSC